MFRILGSVATVVALVASFVVLYSHVRRDGVSGMVKKLGFRANGSAAAADELLGAAVVLESAHEQRKTYVRTDLSRYRSVVLSYASSDAYCIQVEKGGEWFHLVGPAGVPATGSCQGAA
jgi:hypothetical protein